MLLEQYLSIKLIYCAQKETFKLMMSMRRKVTGQRTYQMLPKAKLGWLVSATDSAEE